MLLETGDPKCDAIITSTEPINRPRCAQTKSDRLLMGIRQLRFRPRTETFRTAPRLRDIAKFISRYAALGFDTESPRTAIWVDNHACCACAISRQLPSALREFPTGARAGDISGNFGLTRRLGDIAKFKFRLFRAEFR